MIYMILLVAVCINPRVFIRADVTEELTHLPCLLKNSNKKRQKVILTC